MTKQERDEYERVEVQFVVRGLQLLDGGGIIALLAFLGQTWDNGAGFRLIILISMALMGIALACVQLSTTIHLRAMYWDRHGIKRQGWWNKTFFDAKVDTGLRSVSFILFMVSGAWLIIRILSIA